MAVEQGVQHPRTGFRRRPLYLAASALLFVSFALLGLEGYRVVLGTNFHTVLPGQVHRSAQLKASDLGHYVQQHGIKTVINLRGCCPSKEWYTTQRETVARLGMVQKDVNFSSYNVPPVPELRALVEALTTCEYPILMHCRRGSDRTGLATTLAVLLRTDATVEEARGQLSMRFGHLQFSRSGTLHDVIDMYEDWLKRMGEVHRPELLKRWAMDEYRPLHCWAEIVPLEVPMALAYGQPEAARFRVFNRSRLPWKFKQSPHCGVHLRYLLRSLDQKHAYTGGAGFYDTVVGPGESIDLTLALPAVRKPGRYLLLVDMADEERCWFFMVGSPPYEMELVVGDERGTPGRDNGRPARRAAE